MKLAETRIPSSELLRSIYEACADLDHVSYELVYQETIANLYPGISLRDAGKAAILAARSLIEREPAYSFVAARLLLQMIYAEARLEGATREVDEFPLATPIEQMAGDYPSVFKNYIERAVRIGLLSNELLEFDLDRLAQAIKPQRDLNFKYIGLQTLYDRYLIKEGERRIELPQAFWMRVAMGLAIREREKEARAAQFYEVLSTFRFCSSTPTLFNSGTLHPQLSSCYLTTIKDDLDHIFKSIKDNALLSKWSGGLGNDWTNVRALGSHIKGTNGKSQGVVPFLKVANDTAVAVNQGGKRRGAVCAYLETWHLDIEEFLELRKNTGDERRRTHDMNTANWVPDLFMQRVAQDGEWTLFSPNDVPDLHDLYGKAFAERYEAYEAMTRDGRISHFKRVRAVDLWRKMLTMLFETGHPWITFKDPSNLRSPQDHAGVIHSSNLCTEILLNTDESEVAVCNLGSVNLAEHVSPLGIDHDRLRETVTTAMRMLDNVIDINYYPIPEARAANLRHRPVGLGMMGFQDALYTLGISYASNEAVDFADKSMEAVSYYAVMASVELAKERGAYPSFKGSKWDRGLLPLDTLEILAEARGDLDVDTGSSLDWDAVRQAIAKYGMRNSNTTAIAPTATISNIVGCSQSIEPAYRNLYVKSNLSGDFTVINERLVWDLKLRGLWDEEMISDLKYYDGSALEIDRVPDDLKALYLTAFEIDPSWIIECASRRQKWIDMSQALNLYVASPNGRKISDMYMLAWKKGLKTTYYLRSLGATQIEKSTLDVNARGIQPRWMKSKSPSSAIRVQREADAPAHAVACALDGEECEACQ